MHESISGRMSVSSDVMARAVGDEMVILNLKSGTYFGLDAVGSRIWDLIVAGKSLQEVLALLVNEYDASAETLEHDLLKLVKELQDQALIHQTPGAL